jgi:hypothetical protein
LFEKIWIGLKSNASYITRFVFFELKPWRPDHIRKAKKKAAGAGQAL